MAKADDKDMATELLIQEVNEDLRHDQFMQLWKRYGSYVIAAVVALVVATAGYQAWRAWRAKEAAADSVAFGNAISLLNQGKVGDAETALGQLAAQGHTGFAIVAALQQAALLSQTGNVQAAEAAYDRVAVGPGPKVLTELAVIKRALLALGTGENLAPVKASLAPMITTADDPWHYAAAEINALIAHQAGDKAEADTLFRQLADDAKAPEGVRARAAEMLAADSVVPATAPSSPAVAAPAAVAPAASPTPPVAPPGH